MTSANQNTAPKIKVNIDKGEAGLFHATSPDLPDLFVSGETVSEILNATPKVIAAIWRAKGKAPESAPKPNHTLHIREAAQ